MNVSVFFVLYRIWITLVRNCWSRFEMYVGERFWDLNTEQMYVQLYDQLYDQLKESHGRNCGKIE